MRTSFEKPIGAEHGRELGPEHLEGDLAVVLHVAREVDRGHPTGAELPLEAVAVGQARAEPLEAHRASTPRIRDTSSERQP